MWTSFFMSQVYMQVPWLTYWGCKSTQMVQGEPNIIDEMPPEHLHRKAVCVLFNNENETMCGLIMFNQLSMNKKCIIIAEFSGLNPKHFYYFHLQQAHRLQSR